VTYTEPGPDTDWNEWGPTVRVRVEAAPVMILARTLDDPNPVYSSEVAAAAAGFARVPAPPTFTFVMAHSGTFPDLQPNGATEWGDLDGAPVVTEQIVSLFFPEV